MDAVTLHVADLSAMSEYYRQALGLEELDSALARPVTTVADNAHPDAAVLGREGRPLMVLVRTPGLPAPRRGPAGLFHTALLFPDRAALAAVVASAARHPRSRYVGAADHLVSQAFYFSDPEGNGIELYWDRPRAQWTWHAGHVEMATLALDPNAFLEEHLAVPGVSSAQVGHVHLKVGDIETARRFYLETLGFSLTADLGSALFFSAGGYHHHMAVNTWESAGAGARAATIGLGQVSIVVPTAGDVEALADRLGEHSVGYRSDGRTLRFEDPWKTLLEVSAADQD